MLRFGTLTSSSPSSSSSKIILDDFPAGNENSRRGTEILSSVTRKTFHLKFLRLDSAQSRILLKPIPLSSSSFHASQVNIEEAAEIEHVEHSPRPRDSVRVRFQLRKECVFGEHFFILGDHPVFGGLWDPDNALPLNWSDGHVWTIDLDLPVGRLVEFKFIRKAMTGEILWQPGPNRALETWETNKTIRVCEDWENADLQMMMEEDSAPVIQEEKQSSVVNLDIPIVAENITPPEQSVRLNTDVLSNSAEDEDEVLGTVKNSLVAVVEDAGYISNESDENSNSDIQSEEAMEPLNGAVTAGRVWEENVTKEAMFTEEEGPVLVPGLIPLPDLEIEAVDGHIPHVSEEAISEGKTERFPEVCKKEETEGERDEKQKVKVISSVEKSEGEAKGLEKMYYSEAEEEMQLQQRESLGTPSVLIEKDIQWGRRTLYKLLSNFGLF